MSGPRYLLDTNAVISMLNEPGGAGQALAQGLVLVTRNVREFERVPGLQVENWQDA